MPNKKKKPDPKKVKKPLPPTKKKEAAVSHAYAYAKSLAKKVVQEIKAKTTHPPEPAPSPTPKPCRCSLRWPQAGSLFYNAQTGLTKALGTSECRKRGNDVLFVPWQSKGGAWPFKPERSHTFIYAFGDCGENNISTPSDELDSDYVLRVWARVGLGRCECGNVVLFSEDLTASHGGTFSKACRNRTAASISAMRSIMLDRTSSVAADLRFNAVRLPWPFLPEGNE